MFHTDRSACLHVQGKTVGAVRGKDRVQLMKSTDRAHAMRGKAFLAATAEAKATGNTSLIPSKDAAKKISAERRHEDRKSPDLAQSLRLLALQFVTADKLSKHLKGQLHDFQISDSLLSVSIYSEQTILVHNQVASLPGGLFADYTGGLCSPWNDSGQTEHKLLHFFLGAPSYAASAPLPLFELITSDQAGAELYAALSAFKAACLRILRHPIQFARLTFDMAPHILSTFSSFCNAETSAQYRARRWAEARAHKSNPINKARMAALDLNYCSHCAEPELLVACSIGVVQGPHQTCSQAPSTCSTTKTSGQRCTCDAASPHMRPLACSSADQKTVWKFVYNVFDRSRTDYRGPRKFGHQLHKHAQHSELRFASSHHAAGRQTRDNYRRVFGCANK